ncbi:glycoside hydrolase family 3 C-terminal domain-containing protein (plasmid) [Novosphingobium rhizosphaerae]
MARQDCGRFAGMVSGARGGEAIASILFGEVNPSGRLPISFPAREADLPRPKLDGADWVEPTFVGAAPTPEAQLPVNYDIEGSDVGYRWYARTGRKPLFPFGFGLSYTRFETSGLQIKGNTARFTARNLGQRAGATVAQLYLVSRNGQPARRLAGFQRIELAPAEQRSVTLTIDPRILAAWNGDGWTIAGGEYGFALGENAEAMGPVLKVAIKGRTWRD